VTGTFFIVCKIKWTRIKYTINRPQNISANRQEIKKNKKIIIPFPIAYQKFLWDKKNPVIKKEIQNNLTRYAKMKNAVLQYFLLAPKLFYLILLLIIIILYQYPLACFIAHERNSCSWHQLHAARSQPFI